MVARHLQVQHRFLCLTDQPDQVGFDIAAFGLQGWWAKVLLFSPEIRGAGRCLYLDLDTIIVGDLTPLAEWSGDFGICENFTRLAGNTEWPCRYGSCAMVFADGWGDEVWQRFWSDAPEIMERCPRGDQQAIEELVPDAGLLQHYLPAGFFTGYRDLPEHKTQPPAGASVIVFGGANRPHNCDIAWAREAWHLGIDHARA